MQAQVREAPSDFQLEVYKTLLYEVGNGWKDIQDRMAKSTMGMDIMASAKIREEIVNLIEFCIRFEMSKVFVVGRKGGPLKYGELYIHPQSKRLCVVTEDG